MPPGHSTASLTEMARSTLLLCVIPIVSPGHCTASAVAPTTHSALPRLALWNSRTKHHSINSCQLIRRRNSHAGHPREPSQVMTSADCKLPTVGHILWLQKLVGCALGRHSWKPLQLDSPLPTSLTRQITCGASTTPKRDMTSTDC